LPFLTGVRVYAGAGFLFAGQVARRWRVAEKTKRVSRRGAEITETPQQSEEEQQK
jgi:hypothetical protein